MRIDALVKQVVGKVFLGALPADGNSAELPEPAFHIYDTIPQMRKPLVEDDEEKRTFYLTIPEISRWIAVPLEKTRDELNKFSSRNKIAIYDDHIIVANVMDMKRTVDTYYTNLEEEEEKQKQQQAKK